MNQYILANNNTLPELLPALITQDLNIDSVTTWLGIAQQSLLATSGTIGLCDLCLCDTVSVGLVSPFAHVRMRMRAKA
jgi:hypothetical protein